jgi:hypothetical protein
MYVEVFRTTASGQVPWFKVYYKDGVVNLDEVPEKVKATWQKFGLRYKGKKVMPEDGEDFLRAIARDFNGSMARSNDPIESDEEEETLRNSMEE